MNESLDPLFRPRSVAVIGASRHRGSIAGEVFHNLMSHGLPGPIYPVNPAARAVQSVRAYSSIEDVPETVDLAVSVVPQRAVLDAFGACVRCGVRGLVVLTAGFAETGADGKELQDELVRTVRSHGVRMLGPNCLGLLTESRPYSQRHLRADMAAHRHRRHRVAVRSGCNGASRLRK